jgi:DNA replication and repair protein RecF
MRVCHLSLTNFRLYARLEADLPAGPLILVGANAQGKTSLLEAIYYFATAQSHHAASDRQLINFLALRENPPFARIVAEVGHGDRQHRVEIRVILDPVTNPAGRPLRSAAGIFEGDSRLRKEIYINGVKKRVGELAGLVNVVLFLPQDLAIVEGAPADRRRHLDIALCQVNPAYNFALGEYGKVLSQRNALLKMLQDTPGHGGTEAQLDFWDAKLCEHGALLIAARSAALAEMEALASAIHRDLTGGAEGLRLAYHPAFDPAAAPNGQLGLPLDVPLHRLGIPEAEIQARLMQKLRATRAEEIARGLTLSGPHRDEIRFIASGMDVGTYGSRGQARTVVLALKLAEVEWMRARTGEWPILLLDEVLAELDTQRRRDLLNRLGGAEQCVLTTTDLNLFPRDFPPRAQVWQVQAGQVERGA